MQEKLNRLLKWSEKYTRTDMLYLANGGFWLSVGQIISSGSALILTIAFANLASVETYGTYRYILAIAALFSIFSLPGMGTAITRAVAKDNNNAISLATRTRVEYSLLGTLVALVGCYYYFLNENIELSMALLVIAVTLPVFDTFTLYTAYLLGKEKFDTHTKYQFIIQLVSISTLILALLLKSNLTLILIAYFVPLILLRIFFYFRVTKGTDASDGATELNRQTLAFGKHLTLMSLPSAVSTQIDKILMWKFFGPAQLAMYAISLAVPTQIQGLLKRVDVLALPKLSTGNASNADITRKWFIFTLGTLPIAALYVFLAPFIFYILFPQYSEAVFYSQILAFIIILTPKTIIRAYMEAKGNSKKLYLFHTTTSITKIALMAILIPTFGLLGAVWAILINETISLILIFTLMRKGT